MIRSTTDMRKTVMDRWGQFCRGASGAAVFPDEPKNMRCVPPPHAFGRALNFVQSPPEFRTFAGNRRLDGGNGGGYGGAWNE